jgi:anti-sigma factor RsiW
MNEQQTQRLQAWFDGEVSAAECAEIEALLEADPEARTFVGGLTRTREVLGGSHATKGDVEAAWNRVEARITRMDEGSSSRVLKFPQLIAVAAAVVVVGMMLWLPFRFAGQGGEAGDGLESTVMMVETDLENATPVVYIDQPSGWTVVWVMEEPLPEKI